MKLMNLRSLALLLVISASVATANAQKASPEQTEQIQAKLEQLNKEIAKLKGNANLDVRLIADVEIYAKAAEWILRHNEFYLPRKREGKEQKPSQYPQFTLTALDTGLERARELAAGKSPWRYKAGKSIRGYYSRVDNSVQPYAITLPEGINPNLGTRYPTHVKLHGRNGGLNEVRFIHDHDKKPLPEGQKFVQIDVFGRTNNAYRWAGETDVLEALTNAKRMCRIDSKRTTLWGFSMGGAGAWHLGLHFPSMWSSVGPGAGFVDFYKYQKQTEQRPIHQHKMLRIYDSVDYALNAYNVPICTYGGELDAQLVASTSMVEAAKKLDVDIELLIGKGMGHKFHPDSFKEFMGFHTAQSKKGRPNYPGRRTIRFVTYTMKYDKCEWMTIGEILRMYEPATVEATYNIRTNTMNIRTKNIGVIKVSRDVADYVNIDGTTLDLSVAAEGLLPDVYYELGRDRWEIMSYQQSRDYDSLPTPLRKRRNLQGPIDDAFMESFICVRGTGDAWSENQTAWANWTLKRFEGEFDKWLRGKVRVVDDKDVTPEMLEDNHLILFGDPGSNSWIAKVIDETPIEWNKDSIKVGKDSFDPNTHGLSFVYPNPENPKRYIVINSGHTFHERDFKASNSWLFPRLGDYGVQKFTKNKSGGYDEEIVLSDFFNGGWVLKPAAKGEQN